MSTRPELHFMERVRRDVERCRRFLRGRPSDLARERIRAVMDSIHAVRANPELNPVGKSDRATGLDFRVHYVEEFAIVYVYFKEILSVQKGMVSIRAIRYADENGWQ